MLPSGEKARESIKRECPSSICLDFPVTAFHIRTVFSYERDTVVLLSGENAKKLTECKCPSRAA